MLDRVRDVERRKHGVESGSPALDRVADQREPFGRRPGSKERLELARDELDRPTHARALEEVQRPVERWPGHGRIGEELALEVAEWRLLRSRAVPRDLLHGTCGEACEILDCELHRRER